MKFGEQILDKSVPEWKYNNINYGKLKIAIKEATSIYTNEDENQRYLSRCTALFIEEFNTVNTFTCFKIKEISSRILSIESSIIRYSEQSAIDQRNDEKTANNYNKRLLLIRRRVKKCSIELKMLSRYLILQRVATRRLFEKFTGLHPKGKETAKEYIANTLENSETLKVGYEGISFMSLDLEPYLLEISLILDVLDNLKAESSDPSLMKQEMAASYKGGTYGNLAPTENISEKVLHSTLEFDTAFLNECVDLGRFILSSESTSEFKFILLSNKFQLLNDDLMITSKDIVRSSEIRNTLSHQKSSKSLKSVHDLLNIPSFSSFSSFIEPQNEIVGTSCPKNSFTRSTISLTLLRTKNLDEDLTTVFESDDNVNQHPDILLTNLDSSQTVLMCHVGGIRDHVVSNTLSENQILNSINKKEADNILKDNKSALDKLVVDWLQSHDARLASPTITFKRTRFFQQSQNFTYLLTLDEDISIENECHLPHSIFDIKRIKTNSDNNSKSDLTFMSFCELLVENKVQCYPLDHTLTMWNFCLALKNSANIDDDFKRSALKHDTTMSPQDTPSYDEFFDLGRSKLTELCSSSFRLALHSRDRYGSSNNLTPHRQNVPAENKNINKNSDQNRIRYWNEFDAYDANTNENSFYTNDEEENLTLTNRNDSAFVNFNKDTINYIFHISERLRELLHLPTQKTTATLYGSMGMTAASDEELQQLRRYETEDISDTESVYEYKHDEIISLLYLSALVISCITSGLCLGIILALFKEELNNIHIENINFLIFVLIASLIVSLSLITFSILLLFSRLSLAPIWHYIVGFFMFFVVTCTVCYGIVEIFY
ncbi:hypothetical protein KAFR_0A02450 [Kazachstania africana CBS 2517]|uniref:SPX domain-containing protein n=1 Tax=Kazachstania africana (strain ATCC 22294 / BCRC 22015 / CBS 2517 / CECT 1963 / NBRC 1671 / NRRL Y-8276) TaxID=1071382 RepID=H2AMT3_KAZAF|nr:hypothetical protein KAFR_0A02450 [Kazachstania africana CBS 2517]CCF55683.1 hypothetical protein KAFR_0A02450 [Kazachstania africana CBS 2517]